jgi:L-arabinokinase
MWRAHIRLALKMAAGHGLGHATRVIEVSRHLLDAGHAVTIVSSAALARHTHHLSQHAFALRDQLLDCGSKQVTYK